MASVVVVGLYLQYWYYTHTTVLRLSRLCVGQPRWSGIRRNLLWWSIVHYLLPPSVM